MNFIHLHIHTEYSISDSIIRIDELVKQIHKLKMPAVGVADRGCLFSAVKVYKECIKYGIKPLIGVELLVRNTIEPQNPYSLVLICQNLAGYRALCAVLTRAQHEGVVYGNACIERNWLRGNTDNMIALCGAQNGEIGRHLLSGKPDEARQLLTEHRALFPDRFYLELSRIGRTNELAHGNSTLELAESTKTPVVATNQPRFIRQWDFGAHEIRICIQDREVVTSRKRRRIHTDCQFVRSEEEMQVLFSDLPGALDNSLEIAKRCNFKFDLKSAHFPAYPHDTNGKTIDEFLEFRSRQGLDYLHDGNPPQNYIDRLNHELGIIKNTQFSGYFLIVAEIIEWARSQGIPVGPGRGSGAGSLVAYCLNITSIDPIEYDLIFERFLNPERVSPPDFDIDFCVENRDRVIEYVSKTYGKDRVAQIITYNKMAARAAIRDVGRALKPDYGFYDELAKQIPRDLNITLKDALKRNSDLNDRYKNEPRVTELFDSARKLEGIIRNVSKHPGGVVIAPDEITKFSALMVDNEGNRDVTHYDKDDLEEIGLIKFDFLGLTTLTVIARSFRMINEKRKKGAKPLSEHDIKLDDKKTFENIAAGRTAGMFQLESGGMRRLIQTMKPEEFNDLIALLALFRPGPLQTKMDETFVKNRKSQSADIYLHPVLKDILESTYGVILYQEQVMKIAQVMAGYTLGEADILRRAMGKKDADEMAKQREVFTKGSIEKGYPRTLATKVYDLIESFGGYGFNKSHSVAYALLAFRTAWLKTHYPAEFLAASMSVDMNTKPVAKFVADAAKVNIEVIPPDINECEYEFTAPGNAQVLYGLGAVKHIGSPAVQDILDARSRGGPFKNVVDFVTRVNYRKITKTAIQALASAGAFDSIDPDRDKIYANAEKLCAFARKRQEDQHAGQLSLFGSDQESLEQQFRFSQFTAWTRETLLKREKEFLGIYFSGHPKEKQLEELKQLNTSTVKKIVAHNLRRITACGWISRKHEMSSRGGKRLAYIDVSDLTGDIFVVVPPEVFEACAKQLEEDELVVVTGIANSDDKTGELRMTADNVFNLEKLRSRSDVRLILNVSETLAEDDGYSQLKYTLEQFKCDKGQEIHIRYNARCGATALLSLGHDWQVRVSDELLESLKAVVGSDEVLLDYANVRIEPILPPTQDAYYERQSVMYQ